MSPKGITTSFIVAGYLSGKNFSDGAHLTPCRLCVVLPVETPKREVNRKRTSGENGQHRAVCGGRGGRIESNDPRVMPVPLAPIQIRTHPDLAVFLWWCRAERWS